MNPSKNDLVGELTSPQNWAAFFFIAFWIVLALYIGKSRELDEMESVYRSLPPAVQRAIQREHELRQEPGS